MSNPSQRAQGLAQRLALKERLAVAGNGDQAATRVVVIVDPDGNVSVYSDSASLDAVIIDRSVTRAAAEYRAITITAAADDQWFLAGGFFQHHVGHDQPFVEHIFGVAQMVAASPACAMLPPVDLAQLRRAGADDAFGRHDFGRPVEGAAGWDDAGDACYRTVFLADEQAVERGDRETPSVAVRFVVAFHPATADIARASVCE